MNDMLSIQPISSDVARLVTSNLSVELTREEALHLGQQLVSFGLFRGAEKAKAEGNKTPAPARMNA